MPCRSWSIAAILMLALSCRSKPIPPTAPPPVPLSHSNDSGATGASHPNVLLIVADDLNDSLHCYGHPLVQTPNLDRLCARGVRFTNAYVNYPVCNPSRTSFLTGLRPTTTHVLDNKTPFRTKLPDALTLPRLYKNNGYFVARVGKIFHDGMEDPADWDARVDNKTTDLGERGEGAMLNRPDMKFCRFRMAEGTDADQQDGQTAATAIQWLGEKRDKPFFLAVGFRRPHDPWIAPKRFFDLYPPERIHMPTEPKLDLLPMSYTAHNMRGQLNDEKGRQLIRAYYASISFMDSQLGKVLDAMDSQNLWDNTIVVFLSDHGWHQGDHNGLWLKATLFDQTTRVPFIVAAPGKSHGKVANCIVEFIDLYPTLAGLCALPAPSDLQGRPFTPLLDNPAAPFKSHAITVVSRPGGLARSVRTDRYRYTEYPNGSAELYDHTSDPHEFHNAINDNGSPEITSKLKPLLASTAN